ncbi:MULTISPECIES: hypothetical protein [unclassified Actinomadura]|uniref:hypothetical protein n=1 Tax=unclassified Actinomadura TaxID=2626254 RepID=UPI00135C9258|nr:hypothetical protein [Actinomadura sp. K4S16]
MGDDFVDRLPAQEPRARFIERHAEAGRIGALEVSPSLNRANRRMHSVNFH